MSTISSDLRTEWSEQLARALVTRGLLPDYVVLPVLARARDAEQPLATLLISEGVATPAVVVSTSWRSCPRLTSRATRLPSRLWRWCRPTSHGPMAWSEFGHPRTT
jgi:hypothetical protein